MILAHSRKANRSLSFSKRLRQTLQYRAYVKCSWMLARRTCTPSDLAAAAMEALNRFTNQGSEYWYIGSMFARSAMAIKGCHACAVLRMLQIPSSNDFVTITTANCCMHSRHCTTMYALSTYVMTGRQAGRHKGTMLPSG